MTRQAPRALPAAAAAALLCALAGAPRPGPAAPGAAGAAAVRVGTWNVEWLGKPDKRWHGAQKAEDVAAYLVASKVDLLGLNEISHDADGDEPRTNKTLAEAFAKVKEKTGKEWRHVLFGKEDRADKDQLCGVAWNADRVKLVDRPVRVAVRRPAGSAIWNRHPYAAKFSFGERKTDLVLIPVHMKSNVGGEAVTGKQRSDEAKALVRSLGALQNHFADDDVVLVGDFNCLKKSEPALSRYAGAGFRDLNERDLASWIESDRYPAAPFDRILVPEDQPEFVKCELKVFKEHHLGSEEKFRERLSDHYLVATEVKVADDDD